MNSISRPARSIFFGMSILVGQTWLKNHALVIEGNKIHALVPKTSMKNYLPAKQYEFDEDAYLTPGWIDLHIHGANGHDVMDSSLDAMEVMSQSLAKEGVTGFLATTMTANHEQIETVLKTIAPFQSANSGAAMLGFHLEGPFIAAAKAGAQCAQYAIAPNSALIRHWQTLAKKAIKIVTFAPELAHSLSFIKTLNTLGIVPAIGHTNASYAETCAAIQAGSTYATHLFNAMRGMHHREPGATGALLLADAVTAELILDGMHIHPAMAALAFRLKGKEKLVLVTDAMRAKCLKNGRYELGGQWVKVNGNQVTLSDGTLAGSTLRIPQAMQNMLQFSACSLIDVINMVTLNPARVLNLSAQKGSIAAGKDADLVVINKTFNVLLTMRAGRKIYEQ